MGVGLIFLGHRASNAPPFFVFAIDKSLEMCYNTLVTQTEYLLKGCFFTGVLYPFFVHTITHIKVGKNANFSVGYSIASNILYKSVCVTTIGVCIFRCVRLRLYTLFNFGGKNGHSKKGNNRQTLFYSFALI